MILLSTLKLNCLEVEGLDVLAVASRGLLSDVTKKVAARAFMFLVLGDSRMSMGLSYCANGLFFTENLVSNKLNPLVNVKVVQHHSGNLRKVQELGSLLFSSHECREGIKACLKAGELVDEQHYEISIDIHGIRMDQGLQTKLFDGCTFFFMGDFEPSYRGYLHDLVVAAGGKVLNRKPVAGNQAIGSIQCPATTFIIYSLELPDQCTSSNGSLILNHRRASAEALPAQELQ
ncbi:UNVERIFIED_CONTAM: protein BREAST CANCER SUSCEPTIBILITY 1 [Sesamum radiatum]|uniref:Protein BREAST CANCER SUSCEPTIBILITY 1 n=1 Tax=Sesamum radiatum TaxID=300843 RepID=A0AAW2KGN4_SESRA